jgi:hypothetical protein
MAAPITPRSFENEPNAEPILRPARATDDRPSICSAAAAWLPLNTLGKSLAPKLSSDGERLSPLNSLPTLLNSPRVLDRKPLLL